MNTKNKTDKTAQGKPELPNDKCECGAIAPELCEVYGHLQPQAQHSPLPWTINHQPCFRGQRIGFTLRAKGIKGNIEVLLPNSCDVRKGKEVAELIVASVNHAEALAEALRELINTNKHVRTNVEFRALAALANWEGARG